MARFTATVRWEPVLCLYSPWCGAKVMDASARESDASKEHMTGGGHSSREAPQIFNKHLVKSKETKILQTRS